MWKSHSACIAFANIIMIFLMQICLNPCGCFCIWIANLYDECSFAIYVNHSIWSLKTPVICKWQLWVPLWKPFKLVVRHVTMYLKDFEKSKVSGRTANVKYKSFWLKKTFGLWNWKVTFPHFPLFLLIFFTGFGSEVVSFENDQIWLHCVFCCNLVIWS